MGAPLNYQTPPRKRPPQETAALAAIIALIHLVATFVTLLVGFPLAMSDFDRPGAPGAPIGDALMFVHGILRIPLGLIPVPGVGGWVVLLTNSFIWGVAIAYSFRLVRRHFRRA